jgi:hypothetical protein
MVILLNKALLLATAVVWWANSALKRSFCPVPELALP